MVLEHLLQYLEDNGFGVINTTLFSELLPLGKTGVAIISRGGESAYGRGREMQVFDVYCRGSSNLLSKVKAEDIRRFFADGYDDLCELPTINNVSNRLYKKARIVNIDNVDGVIDGNDRFIARFGAQIIYEKQ